jgi:hypothetical protein
MARKAFIWGSNGNSRFGVLSYATQDAHRLSALLSDPPYSFEIVAPSRPNDPYEIRREMDALAQSASKSDTLLWFFSGHGELLSGKLMLVLDDSEPGKATTYLPVSGMIDARSLTLADNTLIILDCCHAGAAHGGKGAVDLVEIGVATRTELMLLASRRLELAREFVDYGGSFLTSKTCSFLIKGNQLGVGLRGLSAFLANEAEAHNNAKLPRVPIPYISGDLEGDFWFSLPVASQNRLDQLQQLAAKHLVETFGLGNLDSSERFELAKRARLEEFIRCFDRHRAPARAVMLHGLMLGLSAADVEEISSKFVQNRGARDAAKLRLQSISGSYVLTSAGPNAPSRISAETERSIFSNALIHALSGKAANNGDVTLESVYRYITREYIEHGTRQYPSMHGDGRDILITTTTRNEVSQLGQGRKALLWGISEYDDPGLPSFAGIAETTRELGRVLEAMGGFVCSYVVGTCTSSMAIDSLKNFVASMAPDTFALIYCCGYSGLNSNRELMLFTSESRPDKISGLPAADLGRAFQTSRARIQLLIWDSSFAAMNQISR